MFRPKMPELRVYDLKTDYTGPSDESDARLRRTMFLSSRSDQPTEVGDYTELAARFEVGDKTDEVVASGTFLEAVDPPVYWRHVVTYEALPIGSDNPEDYRREAEKGLTMVLGYAAMHFEDIETNQTELD